VRGGPSLTRGSFGLFSASSHVMITAGAASTWTDMPLAATEYLGNTIRRIFADLTGRTSIRFFAGYSVAGFAGSVLRLQYTTDLTGAIGWTNLSGDLPIDVAAPAVQIRAADAIPAAAQGPVLVRVQGAGGNAVIDPVFVEVGFTVV